MINITMAMIIFGPVVINQVCALKTGLQNRVAQLDSSSVGTYGPIVDRAAIRGAVAAESTTANRHRGNAGGVVGKVVNATTVATGTVSDDGAIPQG